MEDFHQYEVAVTFTYTTEKHIEEVSGEISHALSRIEYHYIHPQIKTIFVKEIPEKPEEE